jgi:outer membrane protein with beta-barrel domain
MRSRILISAFIFIALLCASASAQGNYFLLGGGPNFTTFNRDLPSGAETPKQSMRTGFNVMAGFQYAEGGGASLFGVGYETRGAVWKEPNGGDETATIKFSYVHLDFAYKFLAQSEGPAVYAAPLLDLAILTDSELQVGGEALEVTKVNSVDLDLGLSLGIQIPAASNALFLEAGYAYGLFNIITGKASDEASMHNSAIKLRAGFLIGL